MRSNAICETLRYVNQCAMHVIGINLYFAENIGFAEKLLEGDSTELECPISADLNAENVIWVAPDGKRIDEHNEDRKFALVGSSLHINHAEGASMGTYRCIVTESASGEVKTGDIAIGKRFANLFLFLG